MKHLAVAVAIAAAPGLIGCTALQQWAEPRVCDEVVEQTRTECEYAAATQVAGAVAGHQVQRAHYQASDDAEHIAEQIRQARQREKQQEQRPAYRDPEELAEEPINPRVDDSTVDLDRDDKRERFEQDFGIELDDQTRVYRGHFVGTGTLSYAVHQPGEFLALYEDDTRVSRLDLSAYDDQAAPADIIDIPPGAMELIQDGTHQLKVLHRRTDEDGQIHYDLNIYKFIGSQIGTIFTRTIAGGDDQVQRNAQIRYLHGVDDRFIEWTPLDEDQTPVDDDAQVYRWNHWEGVYRIPRPLPTAPKPAGT